MANKQPFVSIVIVNYNGKKLIGECLDSLFSMNYPKDKFEVIVVDNHSSDNSVKFIKTNYKKVKVIENELNNYCQACNRGIRKAKGEFICLLNNDVKVKKDWLQELVKVIKNDNSIGAVTSKLLKGDGTIQNAGLYELPNFYWDERGAGKKDKKYNTITEVDAISGACVLYRKKALEQVGLLDEDFVMFGEDIDMSFRLKKKRWKLVYVPKSVAYHKFHGSCNEKFARELIERNRLLFIAKHHPFKLADALLGNEYFIVNDSNKNGGRLFDFMPSVFIKLSKEHGQQVVKKVVKNLFVELKRIVNYENKRLEEDLKNILMDLTETRKNRDHYKNNESRYIQDIQKKDDIINHYKEEIGNLSHKLKESLDAHSLKDNTIHEIEQKLNAYQKEINTLNTKLKENLELVSRKDSTIHDIEHQLGVHRQEINNLNNKLRESLDASLHKDNTIRDMENRFNTYKEEINNLNNKLKESLDTSLRKDNTIRDMERQFRVYQKEINILNNKLKKSLDAGLFKDNVIRDMKYQFSTYKKEINTLNTKLKESLEAVSLKDNTIRDIEHKLNLHNEEINNLNNKLRESLEVGLRKDNTILEIERQLNDYKQEVNTLSNKLKESLDAGLLKDNTILENERRIEELSKDLGSLQQDLTSYKEEISNLSNKLKDSLDAGLLKDNTIIEMEHQFNDYKLEKERQLQEISQQLNAVTQELDNYKEEVSNLSNKLKDSLNAGLLKDNTILDREKRIEELSQNLSSLQQELQAHKEEIGNLSNKLKDSLDAGLLKEGTIIEIERQLSDYKEEVSNLSNKLKDSLNAGLLKDNTILDREKRIEELSQKLNSLQNELLAHKEELSNLSNKLRDSLDAILFKDNTISEKEHQLRDLSQRLDSLQNELQAHKEEINNLSDRLRVSLDEGLRKDSVIFDKTQQLELTINKLNEARKELSGIYNSEGFRFVLNPLWKFIWYTRIILKWLIKKSADLIWQGIAIALTPLILLQALLFTFEYISELFLGKFLSHFKKQRKVTPFDELTISVVIPNWNGLDLLKRCLDSIYEVDDFKEGKQEVLIVDDASDCNIAESIKDEFPKARVIRNRYNRGFGRTCNRGVREAKGELIVLLNNDIMVSKDFLQPLKEHFKDENVFAVAPKLYYWDKKTFNYGMHMGRFENGYLSLWNEAETGNGEKVSQTSPTIFAVGGAAVFRKRDFLWLGGFDDIYRPNCWEDIDISYRAQKRGLKVLYEPKSIVYHKGASTLNYVRHKEIKNELLFMWKNLTDKEMLLSHLNQLHRFLYHGRHSSRLTFLIGYFWAFGHLIWALAHRFNEKKYIKFSDKKVLNRSMLYYRNFRRNNYVHTEKKTVLLITPFIIYPLNSGGKLRIYNLYKRLKEKYDLILLSLIHHEREAGYVDFLKEIFKEVHVVHTKTPRSEFLFPERYKYSYSSFLIEKLKEIQENSPIDLVHIESNELLYLTKYIKYIPVVYTEHDISILSYCNSYYGKTRYYSLVNFIDYLKVVRYHKHIYNNIDKIIALSKEDIRVIKSFSPRSDYSLIPTGVDLDHFTFREKTGKDKSLIFIGHFPHYPNEEAAVYFCHNIFPIIKKAIPQVSLKLVGSNPTEKIIKLSEIKGVEVIGEVADVKPYLQDASVFVCAFRRSAGIKGKVLEAMATGTPVVCTTRGSYGIDATNGLEILIANKPKEFAKKVIALLEDEGLYKKIAFDARSIVEKKYDWQKISQSLIGVYEQTMDFLAPSAIQEKVSFDRIIELSNQIVEEAVQQGKFRIGSEYGPEELHIELTYKCDSQCIMCDLWDYHKRFPQQEKELTLDEIKQFVDQSEHLKKIKTLVLSGGEPFLRKDLVDICGYFIEKFPNISLGILTNGLDTETIIKTTKEIIKRFKPKYLWLGSSLDGIGEVHDRIRARRGAFSCLKETILSCKKEGIDITLTFTLTTQNFDQLMPAKRFAEHHNVEFYIQFVVPKEVREKSVFNFTSLQLAKIENDLYKIMRTEIQNENYQHLLQNLKDDSFQGLVAKLYYLSNLTRYQKYPKRYFRKCIAGTRFAMFSPFGDLYFCPGLKNGSIGNIREEKLDALWTSKKAESIREFINQELCHCWLVCVVFPVIDEARASVSRIKVNEEPLELEVISTQKEILENEGVDFLKKNEYLAKENSSLNEQEYLFGKIDLESTPPGIGIGAHGRCNADCIFCLGGYPKFFEPNIYNRFFERRLSEVLLKAEFINLCGFGELLLMSHCEEFLNYINKTLPFTNKIITTNGIFLSNKIAQTLTEGKYSLQISLHTSEKKLHQLLTHTEAFIQIIENIENLLSIRKNRLSPSINLVFIANTLNIENLPDFVNFAVKLGVDSVIVNYMTVYSPAHLKLSCFFKQRITNLMFSEAEELAARFRLSLNLPPKFGSNGSNYLRCSEPWKYLYVENEGSILPCCYAGWHIGYLYRDEFQEIWNGEFYKNLRKSLVEGDTSGWCKYCFKNRPSNVNDIRSHVSFRPDLQQKILKGINLK